MRSAKQILDEVEGEDKVQAIFSLRKRLMDEFKKVVPKRSYSAVVEKLLEDFLAEVKKKK